MNKIKYNLKNVHAAIQTHTEDGGYSYDTPKAIPGAVSLSLDAEGETSPFYADGIVYFRTVSNNGYSGDLEMALFPAEFMKAIFGVTEGTTSKVLIENAKVEPKNFALLFEEDGDVAGTKFLLYNCTATRPTRDFATTEDSKTPSTSKISVTAAPLSDGRVMAMTQADTPADTLNSWYTKVFEESDG